MIVELCVAEPPCPHDIHRWAINRLVVPNGELNHIRQKGKLSPNYTARHLLESRQFLTAIKLEAHIYHATNVKY